MMMTIIIIIVIIMIIITTIKTYNNDNKPYVWGLELLCHFNSVRTIWQFWLNYALARSDIEYIFFKLKLCMYLKTKLNSGTTIHRPRFNTAWTLMLRINLQET